MNFIHNKVFHPSQQLTLLILQILHYNLHFASQLLLQLNHLLL